MSDQRSLFEGHDNLGYYVECHILVPVTQDDVHISRLLLASSVASNNDHFKSWIDPASVFQDGSADRGDFISRNPEEEFVIILDTNLL